MVAHVVKMEVEMVEVVVVAHQFSMKTVPIMVGLPLEQLFLDQRKLFFTW